MADTRGHYQLVRESITDYIRLLKCAHCEFIVAPPSFYKPGDKSGLGRYNRARAAMVSHLHEKHRATLSSPHVEPAATSRQPKET